MNANYVRERNGSDDGVVENPVLTKPTQLFLVQYQIDEELHCISVLSSIYIFFQLNFLSCFYKYVKGVDNNHWFGA